MNILWALYEEASRLETQLAQINRAIGILSGITEPKSFAKRVVSATAHANMAAAQKRRWAKVKAGK